MSAKALPACSAGQTKARNRRRSRPNRTWMEASAAVAAEVDVDGQRHDPDRLAGGLDVEHPLLLPAVVDEATAGMQPEGDRIGAVEEGHLVDHERHGAPAVHP